MSDISWGRRDDPALLNVKRLSWGAIFAGVFAALAMEILFLLFGFFVGFLLSPGGAKAWAAIWYLITSFVSLYVGAWVASRLAGNTTRREGMLHGFITWGLATV